MKPLECIYCSREFILNEIFLAHENEEKRIDCCICLNCYERQPEKVKDDPPKVGEWICMRRDLKNYAII